MDEELRDLERIVEQGEGTPEQIQRWIRMKLRGGCEAGAHGALVPAAINDDRLVCELCREPSRFSIPGVGKMLIPRKPTHQAQLEENERCLAIIRGTTSTDTTSPSSSPIEL